MRIVMVGNFGLRTKGTMVARALPLARALARRGHQVCLTLPPWDSPEDAGREEVVDGIPVLYTHLPPALPGLRHLLLALWLGRLAWRQRPEALYSFKPKAYAGAVLFGFWLARLLGLYRGRLVLDADDWEGDEGWNDRERERFNWLERRFIAWHEGWCLRHADAITFASRALEPLARRAGATRLYYLPIGYSPPLGAPLPDGGTIRARLGLVDRPVLLAYTRLAEFAPARLVDVFARIAASRPDAVLLVVGRGLHGEEAELRREVERRGLAGQVVEVGWVEPADIPGYLAAADLALHLLDDSLLNRTKGQAKLLELLAAGVPVVADAVGQATEYVADGRTGRLVPPGDAAAMAAAALCLLADPARRKALGRAAAADVRERWGWDHWAGAAEDALGVGGPALAAHQHA